MKKGYQSGDHNLVQNLTQRRNKADARTPAKDAKEKKTAAKKREKKARKQSHGK